VFLLRQPLTLFRLRACRGVWAACAHARSSGGERGLKSNIA